MSGGFSWGLAFLTSCTFFLAVGGIGSNRYLVNILQNQPSSSATDANDRDIIVFINAGSLTASISYDNSRTSMWFSGTFTIQPLQVHEINVDNRLLIDYQSTSERLVLDFTSNTSFIKMLVYNRIVDDTAVDVFVPMPIDAGALDYYVISFQPPGGSIKVTVMPVVAAASVTYTMPPSNNVIIDNDNGDHLTTPGTLSALQMVTATIPFERIHLFETLSNINGMRIVSDQPVNVLVSSTVSSYTTSSANPDFTQNQMLPVRYWGKVHLVAVQNVNSDRIFMMSATDSTTIQVAAYDGLNQYCYTMTIGTAGQYIDFPAMEINYFIVASEPIVVAHMVVPPSQSFSMYIVTPLEQFFTLTYIFIPSTDYVSFSNGITVYTNTSSTTFVMLDGVQIPGTWTDIPGSGFSYISTSVATNAVHTLSTSNGGLMGGFVHGAGATESYTYPLSTETRDILTGCGGTTCYETSTFDFSSCPPPPTTTTSSSAITTSTSWLNYGSSLFCSNIERKFYISDDFLNSVTLNLNNNRVSCPCNCSPINVTNDQAIADAVAGLKANLSINVKGVGAYRRTKQCADDDRPASIVMGTISAIGIISFMVLVVLFDMEQLLQHGSFCRNEIKRFYISNCTLPPPAVDTEP